jgi:hypothetical protein
MNQITHCWKRPIAADIKNINRQEVLRTHLICPRSLVSTTNTDFVESYRLLRETSLPDLAAEKDKTLHCHYVKLNKSYYFIHIAFSIFKFRKRYRYYCRLGIEWRKFMLEVKAVFSQAVNTTQ